MAIRQPLAKRILLSFTLLTALISGIFAWAIISVVHLVEEDLISEDMRVEMAAVETRFLREERVPDISGSSILYAPDVRGGPLPQVFSGIQPGYQEIITPEGAWHVFDTSIDGKRFVLVRNQDAFEAREQILFKVVVGGLLLAVALAFLIGRLTVRRVIAPVIRLANQVRDRDRLLALAPPLADDYGHDELGQLACAFDIAFGRLRAAIEREQLFTSDVSHELRTPLTIVGTSAELLLTRGELPDKAQRQVERIHKAAVEMQALVETFLQLARAKGTPAAPGEGVTLEAMAHEQREVWQGEMARRGLTLHLLVEAPVPGVWHTTLLRVVMSNLLRNALHYTEQGEIRLIVGGAGFRVEDTGPGIPLAELGDLFQPFVRGQRARGEGLGLGLSLVRRICEQLGWSVTAENLRGGGSRFSVKLGAPSQQTADLTSF